MTTASESDPTGRAVCRIALHGYARVGKDEAGKVLASRYGLERVAFGDLIKGDLDAIVQKHCGFSAFTQNDTQKSQIRELLVHYGYAAYQSIEARFFGNLPSRAVNTRIFRARECLLWRQRGGKILLVKRDGYGPAEPKEKEEVEQCIAAGLIDGVVHNCGDLEYLGNEVKYWMEKWGYYPALPEITGHSGFTVRSAPVSASDFRVGG